MGKFFEYPTPSGIAAGDEKIVMEKSGITYSPSITYIALSVLGDVDVVGISDNDTLVWNSTSEKWEATNYTVAGLSDATITTPQEDDYLKYSGGVWVNSVFPTLTTTLEDLTDTNFTTGAGIDGYALAWDDGTSKWTAQAVSGNPFDQSLNTTDAVEFIGITVNEGDIEATSSTSANRTITAYSEDGLGAYGEAIVRADYGGVCSFYANMTDDTTYYHTISMSASAVDTKFSMADIYDKTYLRFFPNNAANLTSYIFDTSVTKTTGKVATFENNGTEIFSIGASGVDVTGTIAINSGITVSSGTGSPEGVVTAVVGSIYTDDAGGAGTVLYTKESGTGNTGWAVVGASVDLTAFSTNIIPDTDNTYDIGEFSTPYQVKDIYYSGIVYKDGTALTPVVASATAPTDTEVFWIDTSV